MTNLFYTIFNMSLSASVLVLVVLLLRILTKKSPKWVRVLLWGLVAVRLISPFTVESPVSLMPTSDWIPRETVVLENSTSEDLIQGEEIAPDQGDMDLGENDVTIEQNSSANAVSRMGIQLVRNGAFAHIWAFGCALMLLYVGISYLMVYRRIRGAESVGERIFVSERVSSPFVFGMICPRICLPSDMDEDHFRHVIAHERAHISRMDHWWKTLGFLLLAVHWFNPSIWLSYSLLCRDIELACDERVVRNMGAGERADYSEALLASSGNRRMIAACPLAFGEVSVKERIKTVLSYKKPSFRLVILGIVACAAVALFFLTDPSAPETAKNNVTAYLVDYERTLITEGDNADDEENRITVKFLSSEAPMKAAVVLTCKPHVYLTLMESNEQMQVGDTKTFHIPAKCSYTLEAYCLVGEKGNVSFEITEYTEDEMKETKDVTEEEIEALISRYFLMEDMLDSLTGHTNEAMTIDGVTYYRAADERFDQWDEIESLYASVFAGVELARQMEGLNRTFANVEGETWVVPYGWSTILSQVEYRYELAKTGENTWELSLFRKEPDGSENQTVFSVVKTVPDELRITDARY